MQLIKKRYIKLQTEHFLVKTLSENDACQSLANWLADPELMGNLNKKPSRLLSQQLKRFIASHDQAKKLILGVFEITDGKLIGYYTVSIDADDRRASFTILIGDRGYWGKSVVNQTREMLIDYMFNNIGVDKITGSPIARNFPAIFNYKAQNWKLEGILKKHVVDSSAINNRLDIYIFSMLKEDWLHLKNDRLRSGSLGDRRERAST